MLPSHLRQYIETCIRIQLATELVRSSNIFIFFDEEAQTY